MLSQTSESLSSQAPKAPSDGGVCSLSALSWEVCLRFTVRDYARPSKCLFFKVIALSCPCRVTCGHLEDTHICTHKNTSLTAPAAVRMVSLHQRFPFFTPPQINSCGNQFESFVCSVDPHPPPLPPPTTPPPSSPPSGLRALHNRRASYHSATGWICLRPQCDSALAVGQRGLDCWCCLIRRDTHTHTLWKQHNTKLWTKQAAAPQAHFDWAFNWIIAAY